MRQREELENVFLLIDRWDPDVDPDVGPDVDPGVDPDVDPDVDPTAPHQSWRVV